MALLNLRALPSVDALLVVAALKTVVMRWCVTILHAAWFRLRHIYRHRCIVSGADVCHAGFPGFGVAPYTRKIEFICTSISRRQPGECYVGKERIILSSTLATNLQPVSTESHTLAYLHGSTLCAAGNVSALLVAWLALGPHVFFVPR
jgi:hypothetical protein